MLNIVLDAAKSDPPSGFKIDYPGAPDSPNQQGTVWDNLVKPGILASQRVLAFIDLPNANVGYEIGYAIGCGKEVAVFRFKDVEHPWHTNPPLKGCFRHHLNNADGIRKTLQEDSFLPAQTPPPLGDEVLILYPSKADRTLLRSIDGTWNWRTSPAEIWDITKLSEQLKNVGMVIWVILPSEQGEAERDGADNAALSVLAGYAAALPGRRLEVLKHIEARVVADVEQVSRPFKSINEFKEHLAKLRQEWQAQCAQRRAPVVAPARPLVGPVPNCRPLSIPELPEDYFLTQAEQFVGRTSQLGLAADAVDGIMQRLAGQAPTGGSQQIRLIWAHGFGGMGKSSFLHRVRLEALNRYPTIKSLVLDWDKPEWRSPLNSEPHDVAQMLKALAYRLSQVLGKSAAEAYWQALERVSHHGAEHSKALEDFQNHVRRAMQGTKDVDVQVLQLLHRERLWHEDDSTRCRNLERLIQDAPRYRALFATWCTERGLNEDAVQAPQQLLLQGMQQALRAALEQQALILVLDTCEVLTEEMDTWLRELLAPLLHGGLPLLVLVGSRLRPDLHQLAGARQGWRESLPPDSLRVEAFEESLRFTVSEVEQALLRVTRPLPELANLAQAIHRLSLGVPLAVRGLLDMLEDLDLDELAQWTDPDLPLDELEATRQVVGLVAERMLLNLAHKPERQEDMEAILALALLPKADLDLLTALWASPPRARLRELARRYSLLTDGDLHPTVRGYLRRHWRDELQRPEGFAGVLAALCHCLQNLDPPATDNRQAALARQAQQFNLRAWRDGEALVAEIAAHLCLCYVHEADAAPLEVLLGELPFSGPGGARSRRLWHRQADQCPEEREKLAWLGDQENPSWTEEQHGALRLLQGLRDGESAQAEPHTLLAALSALQQAIRYFGLANLPLSKKVGQALFEIATGLDPRRERSIPRRDWVAQALEAYDLARQLAYSPAYAANYMALLWMNELKRPEKAKEFFLEAIRFDPNFAAPRHNLGDLYQDHLAQPEKAEKEYLRAIELDPKSAFPHHGLGDLYQDHLVQPEKAEQEYLRAIELDSKSAALHHGLGNLYQGHLVQPEKAEQAYLRAIQLDPKDAHPHNGLGNLYQDHLVQPEKSEQAYLRAIELDPKFAPPHNGLGNLYQDHLAQPEKAEQAYLRAIELDPKSAAPHNGLGYLYLNHLAQPEKAEQEYLRAIELDPKYAHPHNGLGFWAEARKDWTSAQAAFEQALSLEQKDSAMGARGLGWVALQAENDVSTARTWAEQAMVREPKHPGSALLSVACTAWLGADRAFYDDFSLWLDCLTPGWSWFPLANRWRLAELLRRLHGRGELAALLPVLQKAALGLACWQPWALALDGLLQGLSPPQLRDPKAREILALLSAN